MLKTLRHRCFYSHWKIIVDWKGNFEFQFTVAVKQRKVIPNENKEGQEWETQINADCRWRALRFFSKIFQMCDILPWVISLAFYPAMNAENFWFRRWDLILLVWLVARFLFIISFLEPLGKKPRSLVRPWWVKFRDILNKFTMTPKKRQIRVKGSNKLS